MDTDARPPTLRRRLAWFFALYFLGAGLTAVLAYALRALLFG